MGHNRAGEKVSGAMSGYHRTGIHDATPGSMVAEQLAQAAQAFVLGTHIFF